MVLESGEVYPLTNDGSGGFAAGPTVFSHGSARWAGIGNLDGVGGKNDLALALGWDGVVVVLNAWGPGGGPEELAPVDFGVSAYWVGLADADGDGLDDMVLNTQSSARVLWNVAHNGTFTTGGEGYDLVGAKGSTTRARLFDLDGDGVSDAVLGVTDGTARTITIYAYYSRSGGPGESRVFARSLLYQSDPTELLSSYSTPVVYDYDGDGRLDVLFSFGDDTIRLFQARLDKTFDSDDGVFSDLPSFFPPQVVAVDVESWSCLALGDVNNDNATDIVAPGNQGTHVVYGLPDSMYAQSVQHGVSALDGAIQVADVTMDGHPDWLVSGALFVNDGAGGVAFDTPATDFLYNKRRLLGDVDGDGVVDVIIADGKDSDGNTALYVAYGTGSGQYDSVVSYPTPGSGSLGYLIAFALTDVDKDGDLDIIAARGTKWYVGLSTAADQAASGADPRVSTFSSMALIPGASGGYGSILPFFASDTDGDGTTEFFTVLDPSYSIVSFSFPNANVSDPHTVVHFDKSVFSGVGTAWALVAGRFSSASRDSGVGPDIVIADYSDRVISVVPASNEGDLYTLLAPSKAYKAVTLGLANPGEEVDIFAYDSSSAAVYLWINPGDGDFGDVPMSTIGEPVSHGAYLRLADLNQDGLMDLITSKASTVYLAAAPAVGLRTYPRMITVPLDGVSGQSLASVWNAMVSLTSRETTDTLLLPPGRYTGCPSSAPYPVTWSVTLAPLSSPGSVVFDCSVFGGGVLFAVSPPEGSDAKVTLTLDSIAVVGTRSVPHARGGAGLSVWGSSASLTLLHVNISDAHASLAQDGVVQHAGFGGAVLASGGGRVHLSSVRFNGCSAPAGGGAVAVFDGTLVAESVWVSHTSSSTGVGGALYATSTTLTPRLSISLSGLWVDHTVAHVGGVLGLAVAREVAAADSNNTVVSPWVSLSHVAVDSVSAVWGGMIGMTLAEAPFPLAPSGSVTSVPYISGSDMERAVSSSRPWVSLSSVSFSSVTAHHGGIVYGCGGRVDVEAVEGGLDGIFLSSPSGSGLLGFGCVPQEPTGGVDMTETGDWARVPLTSLATAAVAGNPGSLAGLVATNVAGVEFTVATPVLPSGVDVGSASIGSIEARLVDGLGSTIVDPSGVMKLRLGGESVDQGFVMSPESPLWPLPGVDADGTVVLGGFDISGPMSLLGSSSRGVTGGVEVKVEMVSGDFVTAVPGLSIGLCPRGYGGSVSGASGLLECSLCQANTYANATSADPCVAVLECGEGEIFVEGKCVGCPAFAMRYASVEAVPTGGSNGSFVGDDDEEQGVCACMPGAYSTERSVATACLLCPAGGTCVGGVVPPRPMDGFYMLSGSRSGEVAVFAKCQRPDACTASGCSEGHVGFMCNTCTSEYYSDASGRCRKCPASAPLASLVTVFCVSVLGLALGITVFVMVSEGKRRACQKGRSAGVIDRSRVVPYAVSIGAQFVQVLGIVGRTDMSWPSSARSALAANALVTLDLDAFAMQCSVVPSFEAKYVFQLLLPVAVLGVVAGVAALAAGRVGGSGDLSAGRIVQISILTIGPLVYITLSRWALLLFDCSEQPDGRRYLDADLGVECYTSMWWRLAGLGLVGVVVYVIGIPAYLGWTLYTIRDSLHDTEVAVRYAPLYSLFRAAYPWWQVVLSGKRLVIVTVLLFASQRPFVMVSTLFFVFLTSTLYHLVWRPYFFEIHTNLEASVDLVLVVVTFLGFAFHTNSFDSASTREAWSYAVVAAIVVGYVAIAGTVVVELFRRRYHSGATSPEQTSLEDPCPYPPGIRPEARIWKLARRDLPDWTDPSLVGFFESHVVVGGTRSRGVDMPAFDSDPSDEDSAEEAEEASSDL